MTRSRALSAALAAAVVVAGVFAASPAAAATLPDGQRINVIERTGPMFEVSPVDALVTPVGAGTGVDNVVGFDVDDDGHGYAVQNIVPDEGENSAVLYVADAVAGTLSSPIDVSVGLVPADQCGGLDYSAGVLRAVCYTPEGQGGILAHFGTIDPATGIMTSLVTAEPSDPYFSAIAVNPVDGVWYAFSGSGITYEAWVVDAGAETLTPLPTLLELFPQGADFDRHGQLWISTIVDDEGTIIPTLATLDLATGTAPFSAAYYAADSSEIDLSHDITVWGKPSLPATGASADPVLLVGIALLLALVGAAALAVRARRA